MKFRPEADIWPLMSEEELQELANDIEARGQINPIYLYEGDILDGRNRWLAITKFCTVPIEPKFEDADTDSPIQHVVSLNEKRRHLNESQRAFAAAKAAPFYEAEAKKRQQRAGREYGRGQDSLVPIGTKLSHRKAADDAARDFSTSSRNVARGKLVLTKGSKKLNDAVESGSLTLGKAEQIIKQSPTEASQDRAVAIVAKSKMVTRTKGLTGEIEWYTPRQYLDAVVQVMGGIDLDPASSHAAQQHVNAARFYTLDDDGLKQKWSGKVFLNPPYAIPTLKQFVNKMVDSFRNGDISEGILLTNNPTDTEWWHTAFRDCSAVCFTRGRISFLLSRDGELLEKCSPTCGQTFFYFGSDSAAFCAAFKSIGSIAMPEVGALVDVVGSRG